MRRLIWFLLAALLVFVGVGLWVSRPRTEPALVYFVHWDEQHNVGRLAPGLRMVQGRTRVDFVTHAVSALLSGPNAEERAVGYSSEIPRGTRLLGVRIRGETAYLDFSGEVEAGGGSASMLSRVYQIVYTATHFRGVEEVRILIDGQMRETLGGEGVLIDVPLRRPTTAPAF